MIAARACRRPLAALAQATEWQAKGDGVVLSGPDLPKPMRFRGSSH